MRGLIFYLGLAVSLVFLIGLFYMQIDSNTNSNNSCSTSFENKSNEVLSKEDSPINTKKQLSFKDKKALESNSTKDITQNNTDSVEMPKEFKSIKQQINSLQDEAVDLLAQAEELTNQMELDDQKLNQETKDAKEVIAKLEEEGIIDVKAVEQEVEKMTKATSIEDTPLEIRPALIKADKARLKVEEALIKLNILQKGQE